MVVVGFDYVGAGISAKGDKAGRVRMSLVERSFRQMLSSSWSYWPIESR